jgi:hypothetical protein
MRSTLAFAAGTLLAACPPPTDDDASCTSSDPCCCPGFERSLQGVGHSGYGEIEHGYPDPVPTGVCPDCIELFHARIYPVRSACGDNYTVYLEVRSDHVAQWARYDRPWFETPISDSEWTELVEAMTDPPVVWDGNSYQCASGEPTYDTDLELWGRDESGALWANRQLYNASCAFPLAREGWPNLEGQWRVVEVLQDIYAATVKDAYEESEGCFDGQR